MSTGAVRDDVDELGPEPEERPDLILVVDDDQDIAGFVEFNLKVHGFDVIRARDGEDALRVMQDNRPDLAVVDWMMPGMDGVELTRRLRAEPLTSTLPVIMLTAKSMTVDKVVGLTAGVDDYLVKPFDTAELLARVTTTLKRNKEFREVSPLTGLPGNARVRREIVDRMKTGRDYAVGYIDIDRFKSVNDVYGFDRGDEFITALAGSLHRAVATSGRPPVFLGHIGGDDFVFIRMQPRELDASAAFEADFAEDERLEREEAELPVGAVGQIFLFATQEHPLAIELESARTAPTAALILDDVRAHLTCAGPEA